jgi:leader peptidase (prepilin peptidase)/N-methyltransferase
MAAFGWLAQPAVLPWVALALGLCIGSFLNVVIHRLPRMMEREWFSDLPSAVEDSTLFKGDGEAKRLAGEFRKLLAGKADSRYGLMLPRSRCPHCGHPIAAIENIPVLSYLALRGKCSKCRGAIGLRYPIVELLAGIAAWYAAARFGATLQALAAVVFVWATIALAFIDQDTGLLPDDVTLPLLWIGLLVNISGTFVPLREAVIGAAAGYLSLWCVNAAFKLVRGIDGMGFGDFKMTAAVGAFLGWKVLFLVIFLSAVVGSLFGLAQMLAARGGWDRMFKFHFGPYIAMAGIVVLFWGKAITTRFPAFQFY